MQNLLKVILLVLMVCGPGRAGTPADAPVPITGLSSAGILLDQGWQYHAGDNPLWARPEYDDTNWHPINPAQDIKELHPLWDNPVVWFRLRIRMDSTVRSQSLALLIEQNGASEIYANGKPLLQLGRVSASSGEVSAQTLPKSQLVALPLDNGPEQVIAVRFALQRNIPYIRFAGRPNPALRMQLYEVGAAVRQIEANNIAGFEYFRVGLHFILAILHLAFFCFYPAQRTNLYFFLYSFFWAVSVSTANLAYKVPAVETKMYLLIATVTFGVILANLFFLIALYGLFGLRKGFHFGGFSAALLLVLPLMFWFYPLGGFFQNFVFIVAICWESVRISVLAIRSKQRGGWAVAGGSLSFLFFFSLFMAMARGVLPAGPDWIYGYWIFNLAFISLPIAISLVLALDFALTNRSLGARLVEVEELSEKTQRQEREKSHLEEMNELKSRFFANISHEFRTPLALIRGTVEKLQKKDDADSPRQGDYGVIDRNAGKLLQMINQLLDLSRLESGKLDLHPVPGELSGFLGRLAGSFVSLFESRGIIYGYTAPLQPVWVAVDCAKLEAILSNLLANAAKFTPAGGAVRFAAAFEPLSANQGLLRVVVEDTGIGIAAGELERIFERFYQADASATRSYEGSGIGLSLVKELVALHGGEVKAASTSGKGTTFTVEIPLPLAEPAEKAVPVETAPPENVPAMPEATTLAVGDKEPGRAALPSVQVLVVEDHAELRQFITVALGEHYAVLEAPNGLEGYRMALEGLPDLIISDVMMPGMDGFTLCSTLKTDPRTSHIPVVLLTAKAGTESKLAGLETGADDYLTKPFALEELLLRVRNLLESRRKLREKYGKQLTLNPKEITVTSTDAHFLERVLSIMEAQMANPDFDVEAFSREVAMSRSQLHRKLVALTGQGPGDFIRTIRLKRAAALLQSQAGNVSDVAYQVGFTNLPYFSKAFREHFGQTPSEYARGGKTPASEEVADPPARRP